MEIEEMVGTFVLIILIMVALTIIIGTPLVMVGHYQSCREAETYNKINGTNWSCSDFFWSSRQINTNTRTVKITK